MERVNIIFLRILINYEINPMVDFFILKKGKDLIDGWGVKINTEFKLIMIVNRTRIYTDKTDLRRFVIEKIYKLYLILMK